ncbi:MAG: formate dehydrogenase, partial [Steroidobacteraceae bacterium]|nr:formate dehydrogenase [Steroidobacteraceae bacterium]
MHMVLPNAGAGDPYRIDTLLLYMANMAWNSAMNPAENIRALTARDERSGEYAIRHVIYADAYSSETVAYADLVLPDTTYLERFDCISLLDRPIGSAHGPADAIRQPVLQPDRNVRPFQEVLIELGARLGLPAFTREDGSPRYRDYPDYMINHERKPGLGPLAGWRGENGEKSGIGEPNPGQIARYIENGCFWRHELPHGQQYFKYANRDYLEGAVAMGLIGKAERIVLQLYGEPLQRLRLAAEGHGRRQPPQRLRARVATYCDPLPFWHPPLGAEEPQAFPLSAITQRPMPMYHSWGSQNAWLRQIIASNRLYMNRATASRLGLTEDDWVKVTSRSGELRCQLALMEGVNEATVWTWNAIGKRTGAWNLAADAPESTKGFLLNHVISAFLTPDGGATTSNSDPVTGQAAWFDLRVRVEKCAPGEALSTPRFAPLPRPPGLEPAPEILRYNAKDAP